MLEFYYTYQKNKFRNKSTQLAKEISAILKFERIKLKSTKEEHIPSIYGDLLDKNLFNTLNNQYFTIRQNDGVNHTLLKKYLPELKREPNSSFLFVDFFSGAGGLSQGLVNAGFQPAFVNDNDSEALETYYFNNTFLLISRFYFLNLD